MNILQSMFKTFSCSKVPRKSSLHAFTLTELLAVLLMGALFLSLVLPVLSGDREKDRQAACANNLKQIGQAVEMYKLDNDGWFPARATGEHATNSWAVVIFEYINPGEPVPHRDDTPRIYNCPADRGEMRGPFQLPMSYNMNTHYYHLSGSGRFFDGIGRVESQWTIPELGEPGEGNHWTHGDWVEKPSDTILLLDGRTTYWSWQHAHSQNARGPADLLPPDPESTSWGYKSRSPQGPKHDGKFNFLLCDGSVRPYRLEDTVVGDHPDAREPGYYCLDNHRALGMWTKKKGN